MEGVIGESGTAKDPLACCEGVFISAEEELEEEGVLTCEEGGIISWGQPLTTLAGVLHAAGVLPQEGPARGAGSSSIEGKARETCRLTPSPSPLSSWSSWADHRHGMDNGLCVMPVHVGGEKVLALSVSTSACSFDAHRIAVEERTGEEVDPVTNTKNKKWAGRGEAAQTGRWVGLHHRDG